MDMPQNEADEQGKNAKDSDSDSRQLDTAARAIGLQKRIAYVPAEKKKKKETGNAARQSRKRERDEAKGIKQVTVSVPVEHHDAFRAVAADLRGGRAIAEVLISPAHLQIDENSHPGDFGDFIRAVRSLLRALKSMFIAGIRAIGSFPLRAWRFCRGAGPERKDRKRRSSAK